MDAVHVSPVQQRLFEAIPLLPDYAERPMPIATALRWIPVGQSSAVDPVHPVFITRSALEAIQERALAPADVGASFGFLIGDVYIAPETRMHYVVIQSAIHGGWAMAGDQLKSALLESRAIAQEDERSEGSRLVGWYQTHGGSDARPSIADVEAHNACFDQPWQVAVVVAGKHGLDGGVFRVASRSVRWDQYLPFYELLEGDSLLPGGRKVSGLAWQNYCAPGLAISTTDDVRPPLGPPAAHVLLLDDGLDEDELAREALRRKRPRRRVSMRGLRLATVGALGLVVVGALFGAYRAVASGLPIGVGAPSGTTRTGIDALADSVSLAVGAFNVRAGLFASSKMLCADMATGLIDVETRWTVYNRSRTRDDWVAARHRLQEDVAAVEERFASTGCPRP